MDEKDLLQIKIDEARSNLSEGTKNAIDAIDWRSIVLSMREKKGYSFSQLEDLETETELLLYGLINPESYPKELENRMHISKEEAENLINELNENIFFKIREELIKISENKIKPNTETKNNTKISTSPDNAYSNEEKDDKVLGQSGINIVPEVKTEEKEIHTEKRDDMLNKVENPGLITPEAKTSSLLSQKLNDSFKMSPTETKYVDTSVKSPSIGSKNTDPYREAVE